MADLDISIEPLTPQQSGSTAFSIWLRISNILNNVINLYRPKKDGRSIVTGPEVLEFEQIVDELNGWDLSPTTLAHQPRPTQAGNMSSTAGLRQQLSAIQITRYLEDKDRLYAAHPIPVVVYAASLALSVSYQQLRYSKLIGSQEQAHRDFKIGVNILQTLREKWSAAEAMAALAQKISTELEKYPNLALLRADRRAQRGTENGITAERSAGEPTEHIELDDVAGALPEGGGQECNPPSSPWKDHSFEMFGQVDNVSWMYMMADELIGSDKPELLDFESEFLGSIDYS
ncbi:unnamed protein product [Clonostachys rosea]|uniref:Transcription factor domain-containing protein n=1 Tax=Bionectria ochroleuca TaxID=29856 RepID=A0ABY6TWA8_BIOOC|nr:unnamed protein product [Clonostachys rosea]